MSLYSSHKIVVFQTLKEVEPNAWDALSPPNFPFSDHAFLLALEESGSVGEKAGWLPLYVTAWEGSKLQGATYLYLKNNSYGEYIFDWEWVRAYHESGVPYYPKLVSAVPFTPATGSKLLFHVDADKAQVSSELVSGVFQLLTKTQSQSLHFLFTTDEDLSFLKRHGLTERHSFQYHWKNRGYSTLSDFINALKKKKGKQILREREQLKGENIEIKRYTGKDLTEERAALFYRFYLSTIEKMGAIRYLEADFFRRIFQNFSSNTLLLVATKGDKPIAGSLSYFKGASLFGRYWGSSEEVRNLHFELCYYELIEFAIENKITLFEAGAQGEHKIQRGFLPEITYSAHKIEHPLFANAIQDFIEREKKAVCDLKLQLGEQSPFRRE